jgi:processive 1,2-diacylglycerol beta-glucosyltransferase
LIRMAGMPLRPSFRSTVKKEDARRMLGLEQSAFTVLVMPIWHDRRCMVELLQRLQTCCPSMQVIAVAGKDERLLQTLEAAVTTPGFIVRGWVEEVQNLMASADVVITKPGGQTVSEAMACGKPLILVDPIPGQEALNAAYLEEIGLGRLGRTPAQVVSHIRAIAGGCPELAQPQDLRTSFAAGYRDAAFKIAGEVIEAAQVASLATSQGGRPREVASL